MKYWWVNQNQTFSQETEGEYMWSPKRNKNGNRNQFYEYMKAVSPGDLVFSFAGTVIKAIGVIQSFAYASPQPHEFGKIGRQWGSSGWKVDVSYIFLNNLIRPANHMNILEPLQPKKYYPLQKTGCGNQGVYLTNLPVEFATALAHIIGAEVIELMNHFSQVNDAEPPGYFEEHMQGLNEWEEDLENGVREDKTISETERKSIVLARRGQGIFKNNVKRRERCCRITGVNEIAHLRASHIKAWRYCEDHREKLSGDNGLLLTPTIDHLFDRGFISFENTGDILISPISSEDSMRKMGIDLNVKDNVGLFNDEQKLYMDYHRKEVFLG